MSHEQIRDYLLAKANRLFYKGSYPNDTPEKKPYFDSEICLFWQATNGFTGEVWDLKPTNIDAAYRVVNKSLNGINFVFTVELKLLEPYPLVIERRFDSFYFEHGKKFVQEMVYFMLLNEFATLKEDFPDKHYLIKLRQRLSQCRGNMD